MGNLGIEGEYSQKHSVLSYIYETQGWTDRSYPCREPEFQHPFYTADSLLNSSFNVCIFFVALTGIALVSRNCTCVHKPVSLHTHN